MNQQFRERGPHAEVSGTLPHIPAGVWAKADLAISGRDAAAGADVLEHLAARYLARLEQNALGGDSPTHAMPAMSAPNAGKVTLRFAELCETADLGKAAPLTAADVYGLAAKAVTEKRNDDAMALLAVLAGWPGAEEPAALGLAVIAVRQNRMDDAFVIVTDLLDETDRHPRACSIAGICELARGNKAAAQSYLAAAARIARSGPQFRTELQIAQRALLLMHLG